MNGPYETTAHPPEAKRAAEVPTSSDQRRHDKELAATDSMKHQDNAGRGPTSSEAATSSASRYLSVLDREGSASRTDTHVDIGSADASSRSHDKAVVADATKAPSDARDPERPSDAANSAASRYLSSLSRESNLPTTTERNDTTSKAAPLDAHSKAADHVTDKTAATGQQMVGEQAPAAPATPGMENRMPTETAIDRYLNRMGDTFSGMAERLGEVALDMSRMISLPADQAEADRRMEAWNAAHRATYDRAGGGIDGVLSVANMYNPVAQAMDAWQRFERANHDGDQHAAGRAFTDFLLSAAVLAEVVRPTLPPMGGATVGGEMALAGGAGSAVREAATAAVGDTAGPSVAVGTGAITMAQGSDRLGTGTPATSGDHESGSVRESDASTPARETASEANVPQLGPPRSIPERYGRADADAYEARLRSAGVQGQSMYRLETDGTLERRRVMTDGGETWTGRMSTQFGDALTNAVDTAIGAQKEQAIGERGMLRTAERYAEGGARVEVVPPADGTGAPPDVKYPDLIVRRPGESPIYVEAKTKSTFNTGKLGNLIQDAGTQINHAPLDLRGHIVVDLIEAPPELNGCARVEGTLRGIAGKPPESIAKVDYIEVIYVDGGQIRSTSIHRGPDGRFTPANTRTAGDPIILPRLRHSQ